MDNYEISNKVESDLILNTLIALNCSRSLQIAILYRYGEYDQIVRLDFNPYWYNSYVDARDSLLATELLRKHADLPTNIDKASTANVSFLAAEEKCRTTNSRFFSAEFLPDYDTLMKARRKIEFILGSFDPHEFVDCSGWGPGATLRIKRKDATFATKFKENLELTPAAFDFVKTWFADQFPNWAPEFRIYEGNKVITVPKSAKTDRTIAIEPSGNLFFQKGVGGMIRRRLRKFGVDLNDQSHNQKLAELASKGDTLATVDFSAASDSISYWLVEFLLPDTWFKVLDRLRSQRGLYQDSLIEYEKFSSMGNGFTFELESLIFYALAKSIVPKEHSLYDKISIYGDDLVVPSSLEESLLRLFETCGFTINQQKSYFRGYYRESCGHHYWDGVRICPTYIRSSLTSTDDLIKVHNQITRSHACHWGYESEAVGLTNPIRILRNILNRQKVPMVPPHFGDQGIIVPFDVALPSVSKQYGYGWEIKIRLSKMKKSFEDSNAFHLEKLYGLHLGRDAVEQEEKTGNTRHLRTNRVHVKTTWSRDWPCLVSYFHRH